MQIELFTAEWLDFVELNISGNNDSFNKCDPESFYIESEVFSLFSPCFERSNELYDYFTPSRYNSRRIIPLQNELRKRLGHISGIKNLENFKAFAGEVFLGNNFLAGLDKSDPDWESHWVEYRKKLVKVNEEMAGITEKCIADERVLWVIGY